MALGPKELGSWANEPILSTEIRDGVFERWSLGAGLRCVCPEGLNDGSLA
jgi:hypothetical protein